MKSARPAKVKVATTLPARVLPELRHRVERDASTLSAVVRQIVVRELSAGPRGGDQ